MTCLDDDGRCGECGHPTAGCAMYLDGFGYFHRECLQSCACGWLWPWSLVASADVVLYCSGCAARGGGVDDAA